MFTVGWLPQGTDAVAAARVASERGVTTDPLQAYAAASRTLPPGLLLGFAGFDDAAIASGVRQLAAALREPR
jgi:DNA-binding transcriptional MocR family regulator